MNGCPGPECTASQPEVSDGVQVCRGPRACPAALYRRLELPAAAQDGSAAPTAPAAQSVGASPEPFQAALPQTLLNRKWI